jgi:hypothetical protein
VTVRRSRRALLVAALLLAPALAPAPARAQQSSVQPTTLPSAARTESRRTRLERALDRATLASLDAVIAQARDRGVPTEPLVDRALQGVMMETPSRTIVAAVGSLARRLDEARRWLAPSPTDAELQAGATALENSVPGATLREIRRAHTGSVVVPLGVLTQLVAQKVPVDRASAMVVRLLRQGATPPQLVAIAHEVEGDVAVGIDADRAFDVRTRGVLSALGGSVAADAATALQPGTATNADGTRRGPTSTKPVRKP